MITIDNHEMCTVDRDILEGYRCDESGLCGNPCALFRPADERELMEALSLCRARGWTLTPVGKRTNTVGSAISLSGAILSTERMAKLVDVDVNRRIAVAQPGILLADLKSEVATAGLFYPPDPTSENECSLGGTVATNASGARSLKYGSTKSYIRRLRVLLADGAVLDVKRQDLPKNTAGYVPFQHGVDLFIGSEGTLGIITEIEVDLIEAEPYFFGAVAFFSDVTAALRFVTAAPLQSAVSPRCLELFDRNALDIIRPHAGGLTIPAGAQAAIFFEQETQNIAQSISDWEAFLQRQNAMTDDTLVAETSDKKRWLRHLRHMVPETLNAWARAHLASGGRKVSMDFAVPAEQIVELLAAVDRETAEAGVDLVVRYGHVGNGHPHIYTRGRDAAEVAKLHQLAARLCAIAVSMGGTVAAEHGIGKTKRSFLHLMYPPAILRAMRAVKHALDPEGLLAPGNIFEEQLS